MSTRTSAPPRARRPVHALPRTRRTARARVPAPPIDARIRARRVAVAREAGRRRLRRLLVVVALLVATGAVAVVVWSPFVDVDRVMVAGAGARSAEVRAAADVDRGSPLVLLDTGAVQARVEELAWVGAADVSRDLPGTLRIRVTRRPPVAYAPRGDGQVALVDTTGVVTGLSPRPPGGLPALVTSVAPPDPGATVTPVGAARVAGALGPLAGRVARVFVADGEAALTLADGVAVRLGDLSRLAEKSRAAAAVLGAAGLPGVTYLDVRVPAAPVTG